MGLLPVPWGIASPGWVLGTMSWDPGQLLHRPLGTLKGDLTTVQTSQHLLGESPPTRLSLQRSDAGLRESSALAVSLPSDQT